MEKIDYEISDVIDDYNNKNRPVDQAFYTKIMQLVVKKYELEDILQKLLIEDYVVTTDDDYYELGSYNQFTKSISIKKYNIDFLREKIEILSLILNSEREINLFNYLHETQTLLHECEHAKQLKLILGDKEDIESMILRKTDIVKRLHIKNKFDFAKNIGKIRRQNKKYIKYYKYCPEERLAEIRSTEECLEIGKILSNNIKFNDIILYDVYNSYLDAYKDKKEPTKFYLKKIIPFASHKKIYESSVELSEEEKLLYGLKVDDDYLDKKREEKSKLLNKMLI